MAIGEKLKRLRKEKGVSQDFVAQELHVSRQAVSKWELNEALPDLDNAKRLSEMFGVSIDYLVKDELTCDKSIQTMATCTESFKAKYQKKCKKWSFVILVFSFSIVLFNQILHLASVPMNHPIWRLSFGFGAPLWKFWLVILFLLLIYLVLAIKIKVPHK